MKILKSLQRLVVAVLIAVSAAMAADPPLHFSYKQIKIPGALQTIASQINNAGVIVGTYQDKHKRFHGFVMNGNKVITIDHPKATTTSIAGINPNGPMVLVGGYSNGGSSTGFMYRNGKFTDIHGPAGALDVGASGINDKRQIVGTFQDVNGIHGFLLIGKTYTTLDEPDAIGFTAATGINDHGKVTVYWQDVNLVTHASVYIGGVYTTVDVPNATGSAALDIDNGGDIVYGWTDANSTHGALLHNGTYYQLDFPGAQASDAHGINDKQTIIGNCQIISGVNQSFKATYK
jgi:hypothetical protein